MYEQILKIKLPGKSIRLFINKKAQVYTTGKCKQCALKKECTKAKDERKLMRNTVGEEVFGVLKEDKKFSRFYRREQENVETEMYLIAIGHNIRKASKNFVIKQKNQIE